MVPILLSYLYMMLGTEQAVISPRLTITDALTGGQGACSSTRIEYRGQQYLLSAGHCCDGVSEVKAGGVPVSILSYTFGSTTEDADLCLLTAPAVVATPLVAHLDTLDASPGDVVVGSGHTNGGYSVFHCEVNKEDMGKWWTGSNCPGMPGYSGGGILSLSGQLVGVTSLRYGKAQHLAFVPLRHIYTFLLNAIP
jgi:hypothetical protein